MDRPNGDQGAYTSSAAGDPPPSAMFEDEWGDFFAEQLKDPAFVRAYIAAQDRAFSVLHAQVRAAEAYHSPDEAGDCKGCEYGWPCRTVLLLGGGEPPTSAATPAVDNGDRTADA